MVKIRLRRIGTKGRPYYRVVVANSTSGRNGKFVENLGTYDPVAKPTKIAIDEEKALQWLLQGAQPSETAAYLLNQTGVLGKFLGQRPALKKQYRFLDKRTAAISVQSAIEVPQPGVQPVEPAPAPEPAVAPEPEAAPDTVVEPLAEAEPAIAEEKPE